MAETKPTKVGQWATNANRTLEPALGEKQVGWEVAKKPPARFMNWLLNVAYLWHVWLNERLFDGTTAADVELRGEADAALKTGDGGYARVIGGDSTSDTAGDGETIGGAGAPPGAGLVSGGEATGSDNDGGIGVVSGGSSRGNNGSAILFKVALAGQGAGATQRTPQTQAQIATNGALSLLDRAADVLTPAVGHIENVYGKLAIHDGTQWQRLVQQIYSSVADSAEIADTTTETPFDKEVTISSNTLKAGSTVRVRGRVKVINVNAAPTLSIRARLYGNAGASHCFIAQMSMGAVGAGYVMVFDGVVTVRDTGVNVATRGHAQFSATTLGFAFDTENAATLDTNVANDVEITAQWSAAHADNRVQLEELIIDITGGA